MKDWISVNTKLPKIKVPVLCIIEANCGCEHYVASVLARVYISDDDWEWLANSPESQNWIKCPKQKVKAWQYLDKFPVKYNEGFER